MERLVVGPCVPVVRVLECGALEGGRFLSCYFSLWIFPKFEQLARKIRIIVQIVFRCLFFRLL